jgi:hypothetical protein
MRDDEGRRCGTDELTPNRRYGDYFVCPASPKMLLDANQIKRMIEGGKALGPNFEK